MPKKLDLKNKVFGYLTIVEETQKKGTSVVWKCLYKCGQYTEASTSELRSGHKSSCGCMKKDGGYGFNLEAI